MKKTILLLAAAVCFLNCTDAQALKDIKLNDPDTGRGTVIMKALADRQSVREYSDKEISLQDLSDLLWAANGINRQDKGLRTAPTAMNMQEIDVYVTMESGTYFYDAAGHILKHISKDDLRQYAAGQQDFAATAPVIILITADLTKAKGSAEAAEHYSIMDAGIVSQNISLFCSGCGLATVPRGFMDKDKLAEALGFKDTDRIYLNHPVGYPKQ